MSEKLERLCRQLKEKFGDRIMEPVLALGEVTVAIPAENYLDAMRQLRDDPVFRFEQLMDLSGIDYSEFTGYQGKRYAAVSQLLSLTHNWRLRVKVFAPDDEFPVVASVMDIWNVANWYEREAFDLFGIHFDGHIDLRRILTDYGFVGHPFRKDFPISGYVEMRYDPEQQRVIYQPVTIEPREVTPRIVREEQYAKGNGRG
ncbi:MAG: NADH-quinone oxidoreductase subunit C [Burkholderiaceae bacterium]|nr:NADH-quinone oxidoreductase subunit C [Sulfuritalea sp.]MCF8173656.1 NADH-quinone oxidoreductase subunit C [Burkholderiaceae bacterium]